MSKRSQAKRKIIKSNKHSANLAKTIAYIYESDFALNAETDFNSRLKRLGKYVKEYADKVDANPNGNRKMDAFIYFWINISEEKVYVGKHKGCDKDGYITSGKNVGKDLVSQPQNMKRLTVLKCSNKKALDIESFAIILAHKMFPNKVYNKSHIKSKSKLSIPIDEYIENKIRTIKRSPKLYTLAKNKDFNFVHTLNYKHKEKLLVKLQEVFL